MSALGSLVPLRTSLTTYISRRKQADHKKKKFILPVSPFVLLGHGNRCGDVMKLQIRVDDKGIISDVKFKTFGCGSAIASSSYMTERVKGLSLDEAGKIKNTEIAKELALPPVKLHCSSMSMCPSLTAYHLTDVTSSVG